MSDLDTPDHDLAKLAPKFREAVESAIAACAKKNFKAKVFEAFRSDERQAWLYAQGRTRPGDIVTKAPTSLTSWHGYGLAVDVVEETKLWRPYGDDKAANEKWFKDVAEVFKSFGCNWGGDFTDPDTPHMQWGRCRPSPSAKARELIASGGLAAVWKAVGAD